MNSSGLAWIGVDLDGTLAHYDRWDGPHVGPPIARMVQRVLEHRRRGDTVKIFTARVSLPPGAQLEEQIAIINSWCLEHLGDIYEITCKKDLHMIMLYDDRCVQIVPNTGMTVLEHQEWHLSKGAYQEQG